QAEATEDDEDVDPRELVRRAVARARAELDGDAAPLGPANRDHDDRPPPPSIFAASAPSGPPKPPPIALPSDESADAIRNAAMSKIEALEFESFGPTSLVIENSVDRIEMAKVYTTLESLDAAPFSSLGKYLPHSVTVMITDRKRFSAAQVEEA